MASIGNVCTEYAFLPIENVRAVSAPLGTSENVCSSTTTLPDDRLKKDPHAAGNDFC